VSKTVQGLEQVHFDFLDDVLGFVVRGPQSTSVAVEKLPVALVELRPTALVAPVAKPVYE
jgi:hypothetical protein